jgi:hypothetical protein
VKKTAQRLAAEFTVIVVGVLVALAVDQWREELQKRELEMEYAVRLLADLRSDSSQFAGFLEDEFVTKRDFLLALAKGELPNPPEDDPARMLERLDQSMWGGILSVRDAAFREMQSTGQLGLLRNPDTRSMLADYYTTHTFLSGRFERSAGEYERMVAEAVPGATRYSYLTGEAVGEASAKSALESVLDDPRLTRAVNAELAYAGALVRWSGVLLRRATRLIERLESEY